MPYGRRISTRHYIAMNSFYMFYRFLVKYKLFIVLILSLWVLGILFSTIFMAKPSPFVPRQLPQPNSPSLTSNKMSKAMHYCNPPLGLSSGQEGLPPNTGKELKFVWILIRHGDRGPLNPIRNLSSINCNAMSFHHILDHYNRIVKKFQSKRKATDPFHRLQLSPKDGCHVNELTSIGSLQHLLLGTYLSEIYINQWKLLSKEDNLFQQKIRAYSTYFPRTYQSAVAFLVGLLPDFNWTSMKINRSRNVFLCTNKTLCDCPKLDQLMDEILKKKEELLSSHPAVVQLIESLLPVVSPSEVRPTIKATAAMMVDSLYGYVCHNAPLPCSTTMCTSSEQVRNLIAFVEWQNKQIADSNLLRRASLLKIYGLLWNLYQELEGHVAGTHGSLKLSLYSGHDITLSPFTTVLGFNDALTPPYASRVIVELYKLVSNTQGKAEHAIRVLYNGKDVTHSLSFCSPAANKGANSKLHPSTNSTEQFFLCPYQKFKDFVQKGVFKIFDGKQFKDFCHHI